MDRTSFNRLDSGPASPSGRGPDKPVKVLTHTKLVKELTHLVIIQELNAHNGEAALQLHLPVISISKTAHILLRIEFGQVNINSVACSLHTIECILWLPRADMLLTVQV